MHLFKLLCFVLVASGCLVVADALWWDPLTDCKHTLWCAFVGWMDPLFVPVLVTEAGLKETIQAYNKIAKRYLRKLNKVNLTAI